MTVFWVVGAIFAAGAAIEGAFAIAYLTPIDPSFSTCATVLQYQTLIQGLYHSPTDPTAVILMHFSIYNPNRFEIQVDEGVGTFHYAEREIGRGYARDITFPSGSIIDVFANVTFQPTYTLVLDMIGDLSDGDLFISVLLNLEVSIAYSNIHLIQLGQDVEVSINALQPNKALCICPLLPPPRSSYNPNV